MQLRPRHFILLAVVIGLFVYNIIHHRHQQRAALQQTNTLADPAWSAFDKAAALRDAPDATFQPAFATLRTATEGPATTAPDIEQALSPVRACKTWLYFYRTPQWRDNATKHINGCTKYHRDTTTD